MISPTRIAEITALAEAASEGPWIDVTTRNSYAEEAGRGVYHWREIVREGDEGEDDLVLAEVYVAVDADQRHPDEPTAAANAAFIAAARTAVPELLAEREAMVARMAVLERVADVIHRIAETAEDEGDRMYFASTNDPHTLIRQAGYLRKLTPIRAALKEQS